MLTLINTEDQNVVLAVRDELPNIAAAMDTIISRV
jgi:N-acetylmuramic acid 6-phosphate (MurNAc-6-P) etherase